jgi:hypothetical protein
MSAYAWRRFQRPAKVGNRPAPTIEGDERTTKSLCRSTQRKLRFFAWLIMHHQPPPTAQRERKAPDSRAQLSFDPCLRRLLDRWDGVTTKLTKTTIRRFPKRSLIRLMLGKVLQRTHPRNSICRTTQRLKSESASGTRAIDGF